MQANENESKRSIPIAFRFLGSVRANVNESKRSIQAEPHSLWPQVWTNGHESKRFIPPAPIPLGHKCGPMGMRVKDPHQRSVCSRGGKLKRGGFVGGFCYVIRKFDFDRHHCFTPESQREGGRPCGRPFYTPRLLSRVHSPRALWPDQVWLL